MKKMYVFGIIALFMMAMTSVAFAEEDSESSSRSGGTPKKVCEGTRYSYDNTGVTSYRMSWFAKLAKKVLDPRYETVLRSARGVADFSSSEKWKACAQTAE